MRTTNATHTDACPTTRSTAASSDESNAMDGRLTSDRADNANSLKRTSWLEKSKLLLFSLSLFSTCVIIQHYGDRIGMKKPFQQDAVPTSLLNRGSLGKILQKTGFIHRIQNPHHQAAESGHDNGNGDLDPNNSVPFVFVAASGSQSSGTLLITEVQPNNRGEILDEEGRAPDWIELWNPTSTRFDATDWYLTDNPDHLAKWKFPELIVEGGDRLVLFASGSGSSNGQELHTNFRLSEEDGYLALVRPDKTTVLQEVYFQQSPETQRGVSFACLDSESKPLLFPTPGQQNSEIALGYLSSVQFSHDSCLFESSFMVSLSCDEQDASIYFTTDGSTPTKKHGTLYQQPLQVSKTTIVRAVAITAGKISPPATTRSYLRLQNLVRQSKSPLGFPRKWDDQRGDYAMDKRITKPFRDEVNTALTHLPMVSVVADANDLFGENGIYSNTYDRGFEWEIPANVELLDFEGEPGFHINCGVRIAGNESRRSDWKKHSFRISMRRRYGQSSLEYPLFQSIGENEFSCLMLRSTDDSWVSHHEHVRENAQYIRDQWTRETESQMGWVSARGRFVHVCINGLYWGVYNLLERPDDEFLAHQLGGNAEDYVTMRTRGTSFEMDAEGTQIWDEICKLASRDLRKSDNYQALLNRLDIVNLADYCLLHMYVGSEDWVLINGNNMRAYRKREPGSRLRFQAWDGDSTFASAWNHNSLNYVLSVSSSKRRKTFKFLFDKLSRNPDFRRLMLSRLTHFSAEGKALNAETARQRYKKLADAIEPALMAEAARWGDVHSVEPYSPTDHWKKQKDRILDGWFLNRTLLIRQRLEEYWSDLE